MECPFNNFITSVTPLFSSLIPFYYHQLLHCHYFFLCAHNVAFSRPWWARAFSRVLGGWRHGLITGRLQCVVRRALPLRLFLSSAWLAFLSSFRHWFFSFRPFSSLRRLDKPSPDGLSPFTSSQLPSPRVPSLLSLPLNCHLHEPHLPLFIIRLFPGYFELYFFFHHNNL